MKWHDIIFILHALQDDLVDSHREETISPEETLSTEVEPRHVIL